MLVCRFGSHKSRGHTHICAEHLKGWLREAYPYRDTNPPNSACWDKLVTLVQHLWGHSTLPTDLSCMIFFLITKVNADTQGFCLIEVLWKFVKAIINTRVEMAVKFHNILHGFRSNRVTGTSIL